MYLCWNWRSALKILFQGRSCCPLACRQVSKQSPVSQHLHYRLQLQRALHHRSCPFQGSSSYPNLVIVCGRAPKACPLTLAFSTCSRPATWVCQDIVKIVPQVSFFHCPILLQFPFLYRCLFLKSIAYPKFHPSMCFLRNQPLTAGVGTGMRKYLANSDLRLAHSLLNWLCKLH